MRTSKQPRGPRRGKSVELGVSRHGLQCVSGHSVHRCLTLTVRIGKASGMWEAPNFVLSCCRADSAPEAAPSALVSALEQ